MVSRKGRGKGGQTGMQLPKGITSSKPSTLWKMMKVMKDEGPLHWKELMDKLRLRWKNYPPPSSLYTTLARRTDVFILVDEKNKKYDLKEEIRNAMD